MVVNKIIGLGIFIYSLLVLAYEFMQLQIVIDLGIEFIISPWREIVRNVCQDETCYFLIAFLLPFLLGIVLMAIGGSRRDRY